MAAIVFDQVARKYLNLPPRADVPEKEPSVVKQALTSAKSKNGIEGVTIEENVGIDGHVSLRESNSDSPFAIINMGIECLRVDIKGLDSASSQSSETTVKDFASDHEFLIRMLYDAAAELSKTLEINGFKVLRPSELQT